MSHLNRKCSAQAPPPRPSTASSMAGMRSQGSCHWMLTYVNDIDVQLMYVDVCWCMLMYDVISGSCYLLRTLTFAVCSWSFPRTAIRKSHSVGFKSETFGWVLADVFSLLSIWHSGTNCRAMSPISKAPVMSQAKIWKNKGGDGSLHHTSSVKPRDIQEIQQLKNTSVLSLISLFLSSICHFSPRSLG